MAQNPVISQPEFFTGNGEIERLIREKDWENSSIGAVDSWPQSLLTSLSILLSSKFPMTLFWGNDFTFFYNDALQQSFATSINSSDLFGKPAKEAWQENWPLIQPVIQQVWQGETAITQDNLKLPLKRNGIITDTYWTFNYSQVKDDMANVAGVLVTCIETTNEVISAKKLAESERKFYGLLMQSPVAMAILRGKDLVFELVNDAYLPLVGRTREQLIGKPLYEALPEIKESMVPLVTQLFSEGKTIHAKEYELKLIREGEHPKPSYYNFIWEPLRDDNGEVDGLIVTASEVTEQVVSRQKLEESERRFYTIANHSPAFIFLGGPNADVQFASESWLQFTGLNEENGTGTGWATITHPDDVQKSFAIYNEGFENRRSYSMEIRQKSADGNYHWILWRGVPRFLPNGEFQGIIGIGIDITDRKKAESEMRNSEQKYRDLFTSMDQGYCIIEVLFDENNKPYDYRFIEVNPVFNKHTGIPVNPEGKTILEITPDIEHHWIDIYGNIALSGIPKRFTEQSQVMQKWFDVYAFRVGGENSRQVAILFNDITERKTAEDSLLKTSVHLQIATEAANVGIWLLDVPTQVLDWSPLHKRMWGYDENRYDLTYEDWHKIILPGDKEKAFARVETAMKNRTTYEAVYRIQKANDNSVRWMRSTGQFSYNANGEPLTLTGVTLDITEEKEAEDALKQSEEQMRQLSDFMPQMVWATKPDGYHDFYNRGWFEFTGLTYEETKAEGWAKLLHPEDYERAWQIWNNSLNTGEYYEIEYRMRRYDGEYRWLLARATPFRNEAKEIVRWFGTCTDIHDQKNSAERLEEMVKERTRELQRSNEDLQRFAHVASHDLKEPVRKVKTFVSRLQHEFADELPEKAKHYLSKIDNATTRSYEMIDGVLKYSSLDSPQSLTIEKVDLSNVIKQAQGDLEILIAQKDALIKVAKLPVVEGVSILLHQLFYNLLNNALKFSKKDVSPVIHITCEEKVETHNHQPIKFAVITMQDNGIGFNSEDAPFIFQTFSRLHSKDQYEGSGLGLSLCKKIAERHGGRIEAEGKKGEGALFNVYLPISQAK